MTDDSDVSEAILAEIPSVVDERFDATDAVSDTSEPAAAPETPAPPPEPTVDELKAIIHATAMAAAESDERATAAKARAVTAETAVDAANATIAALRTELETLTATYDGPAASLQASIDALTDNVEALRSEVASKDATIDMRMGQIAALRDQVAVADARWTALIADLKAKHVWAIDVQPTGQSSRVRMRMLVVAADVGRAIAKAEQVGKGRAVGVTEQSGQTMVFDVVLE